MWGIPERQPRRSWRQAVRTAGEVAPRFTSLRAALRALAGHSWYSAAFAFLVSSLTVVSVLASIAFAGFATVTVADERPGLQVAVFVVVTLMTSALLAFAGKRPWLYIVEVLLWKREPPPGTSAVHLHVHEDDHERALWVLLDAGYEYVDYPTFPPPRGTKFPTKCMQAWHTPANPRVDQRYDGSHAYGALKDEGIRVHSIVGGITYER